MPVMKSIKLESKLSKKCMIIEPCQGKILRVPKNPLDVERQYWCKFQRAFLDRNELATPLTNRHLIQKMTFAQLVKTSVSNKLIKVVFRERGADGKLRKWLHG